MQIGVIISLSGAGIAALVFARQKQWAISIGYFFLLAYTVFDKIFPSALPESLVTSFSFVFFVLAVFFSWQCITRAKILKRQKKLSEQAGAEPS